MSINMYLEVILEGPEESTDEAMKYLVCSFLLEGLFRLRIWNIHFYSL